MTATPTVIVKNIDLRVLAPSLIGGTLWLSLDASRLLVSSIDAGLRVMGVAEHAVDSIEGALQPLSLGLDSLPLASILESLKSIARRVDLELGDSELSMTVYYWREKFIRLRLPAERGIPPSVKPRFEASIPYLEFFKETLKLARLRGSETLQVKVSLNNGRVEVKPPPRTFSLDSEAGEVETHVILTDLSRAFRVFNFSGIIPMKMYVGREVLGLEGEYGKTHILAYIAGSPLPQMF